MLKEKTKPVSKPKRRRKINALDIPEQMESVPIIPPKPRPSSIPDK